MSYSIFSEVITPAASHNLTTLSTLQLMLDADNNATEILNLLLKQATADVESYCDRVFASEVIRDTFSVWGRPTTLLLSRRPVTAVASIVDGTATLGSADYKITGGELVRMDGSGGLSIWVGPTVVVNYTAGYVLPGNLNPTLPADVEGAVIDIVRSGWMGRSIDPTIKSEEVPGVYSVTYGGGGGSTSSFSQSVTDRINRYRINPA